MLQDLRFGWRMLRQNKVLTLVAILSLGLGIGATSTINGLVDQLLLHNITAHEPERLVGFNHGPWSSYPNFQDLRASRVFADLAANPHCCLLSSATRVDSDGVPKVPLPGTKVLPRISFVSPKKERGPGRLTSP